MPAEVGEHVGLLLALAQLARTDRSQAAPEPQIDSVTVSDSEPWERTRAEHPLCAPAFQDPVAAVVMQNGLIWKRSGLRG